MESIGPRFMYQPRPQASKRPLLSNFGKCESRSMIGHRVHRQTGRSRTVLRSAANGTTHVMSVQSCCLAVHEGFRLRRDGIFGGLVWIRISPVPVDLRVGHGQHHRLDSSPDVVGLTGHNHVT